MGRKHAQALSYKQLRLAEASADDGTDFFDRLPDTSGSALHLEARRWLIERGYKPGAVLSHAELRTWKLAQPERDR